MEINDDASRALEQIRVYAKDVSSFESRAKTLKEMIVEKVENTDESLEVERAAQALANAKDALKKKLEQNLEYMENVQDLADERESLKAAKDTLSTAILIYYQITGSKQVEMYEKDARDLILTGRLGKSQLFQPSLFHQAHGAPAEA